MHDLSRVDEHGNSLIHFHRIPKKPHKPSADASPQVWSTFYVKCAQRRELLRCCGISIYDKRQDLRICDNHPVK